MMASHPVSSLCILLSCVIVFPFFVNGDERLKVMLGKMPDNQPPDWPTNTYKMEEQPRGEITGERQTSVQEPVASGNQNIGVLSLPSSDVHFPVATSYVHQPIENSQQAQPNIYVQYVPPQVNTLQPYAQHPPSDTQQQLGQSPQMQQQFIQPQLSQQQPQYVTLTNTPQQPQVDVQQQPTVMTNAQPAAAPVYVYQPVTSIDPQESGVQPGVQQTIPAGNPNTLPNSATKMMSDSNKYPKYQPMSPKHGQCPFIACNEEEMDIVKLECIADTQCWGNEKCCLDPCTPRRVCTAPATSVASRPSVHTGYCPAQESCISTNFVFKVICKDDNECVTSQKCCYDQCISLYACKNSVSTPGILPPAMGLLPPIPGLVNPSYPGVVYPPSPVVVYPSHPGIVNPPSPGIVYPPHPGYPSPGQKPHPGYPSPGQKPHPGLPTPPVYPQPEPGLPTPPVYPQPEPPAHRPQRCKFFCPGTLRCCDNVLKPGTCPSAALCYSADIRTALASSLQRCVRDFECSRPEKCCYDQCMQLMVCRPTVFEPVAHPGQCPAHTFHCTAQQMAQESCDDDRKCKLHERCCPSSCHGGKSCSPAFNGLPLPPPTTQPKPCNNYCPGSKQCCDGVVTPPTPVDRLGFCPASATCRGVLTTSPRPCNADASCATGEKCCSDSCLPLKICQPSVTSPYIHPGQCPAAPSFCNAPMPLSGVTKQCNRDTQCTLDQRCCHDLCSRQMVCQSTTQAPVTESPVPTRPPPVTMPPGTTPVTQLPATPPPTTKPCRVYCPGSKVCCDGGEKAGHCPAPALCVGALLRPPSRCLQDYECSGAEKCCYDSCQRQYYCRPAVTHSSVHPGSCPVVQPMCLALRPSSEPTCHEDSDCRYEQRCCYSSCQQRNVCTVVGAASPTPPTSPPTTPATTPPPTPATTLPTQPPMTPQPCTVYCPGSKACCDGVAKPGYCPAPSMCAGALLRPPPSCTYDHSCGQDLKCCYDSCEGRHVCRPAVPSSDVHPGYCPAAQASCVMLKPSTQRQCATDSQCRFEQRCCFDKCQGQHVCSRTGQQFARPVAPLQPILPGCEFPCPGRPKECCDTEMKPGYCPSPAKCDWPSITPNSSVSALLKECSGPDYGCPGMEKCCYNNCIKKDMCGASVGDPNDHPGQCPRVQKSCLGTVTTTKPSCRGDRTCPISEKCCYDICEKKGVCRPASPPTVLPLTPYPSPVQPLQPAIPPANRYKLPPKRRLQPANRG